VEVKQTSRWVELTEMDLTDVALAEKLIRLLISKKIRAVETSRIVCLMT
jgi:hypothetical protein